jgi:hypothetical protein
MKSSLDALATFITNLGPDPIKLPATLPGALQIFLGTVELQLPVLVNAEWGAVQTDAQSKIAVLQNRLQAAVTGAPVAAPAAKPA